MENLSFVEQSFTSMAKCISYIKRNFRQGEIIRNAWDVDTGSGFYHRMPKYFYRGESRVYPSTTSSMHRVKSSFPKKVQDEIIAVVLHVDSQLQEWLQIDSMLSAGYLQHYGLPTELLDISSSLDTASFFGSYIDLNNDFQEGCICVLDTDIFNEQSIVIDLTKHEYASRPRLQNAYTFFHKHYLDLKSQECISELGVHWFYYKTTDEEKVKYFDSLKYLPDSLDDVTAAFVYMCLLKVPFKVSDIAADYIVNKCPIPCVPVVIDARNGEAKTVNQAGVAFDENSAQYNLYRILSNQYADTFNNQSGLNACN